MYSWQLVGAERAPPDPVVVMERIDETLAGEGIALIADIAGFTPLTELLMRNLSPAEGAEELPRALNSVFTPLIGAIHAYGGEVHKFGGDALICWFPRPRRGTRTALLRRALAAAQAMQALMRTHGTVHTRVGDVTLSMQIGAAYGPALRVRLSDVTHGYEDVLGGATLPDCRPRPTCRRRRSVARTARLHPVQNIR
jgi:class 3 adenylate cyclase